MELSINFHHRAVKTVLFNAALNYVRQLSAAPVRQAPTKPSLFAVVVNAKNRFILRKWNFHNFTLRHAGRLAFARRVKHRQARFSSLLSDSRGLFFRS